MIGSAPRFWQRRGPVALALLPAALFFRGAVALRRAAYRLGMLSQHHLGVPTIVVGNISVGGTGKTPLVLWLSGYLKHKGLKVGIVSRGYGASHQPQPQPQFVDAHSDPAVVGDEAVLLARRGACPVVVHRDRVLAASALLSRDRPDVILSDDGLQHYRLARDFEIALVDGDVRFRNGLPLPAGPLREPVARLSEVDVVVCNGGQVGPGEVPMSLHGSEALSLDERMEPRALWSFRGCRVHAVAGIGRPQRFFAHLRDFGLTLNEHPFPDHHAFTAPDFAFANGEAILMTEKDAVKCGSWSLANVWYVPVRPRLPASFADDLDRLLAAVLAGGSV